MLLSILIAATVLTAAAAGWGWRRSFPRGSREHLLLALLGGAALFLLLLRAAHGVGMMLGDSWNFIRLAPSAALLQQAGLYAAESEGAILGWIYGPVLPLLNLPAVLLPDPVSALVAAGIVNEALLLLPLLGLAWGALPGDPAGRIKGVLLLAALQALMLQVSASRSWLQNVHADTPALALGLLSLVVILGGEASRPLSRRRVLLSALLAAASVYGKQVEIGLLPAPLLFLWARDGRRQALTYSLCVAAFGALGLILSLACFGASAFLLNFLLVPARHPWDGSLLLWTGDLLEQSSGLLLLFLGLVLLDSRLQPRSMGLRDWILSRPWCLPAAAALFMLPTSLMGRAKVGGFDPAYHALYYLAAAAGLAAARLLAEGRPPLLLRAAPVALLAAALAGFGAGGSGAAAVEASFRNSRLEREYRFACAHPGEVWFLANPLVTLYSDRRLYHQGYGVYDRLLAGRPPSEAQLAAHRPPRLRWVSGPGAPFWSPPGLAPTAPPDGLSESGWSTPR